MSEQSTEPSEESEPDPEPLRLDVPVYDYVEKGADQPAPQSEDRKRGESK